MLRLLRRLRRAAATVLGLLGGVWSVLMLLLMAGSLALSIAMTMIPAVFSAVAGVVESVTGVRSLATRQADDLARLERRAASEAAARRTADNRAGWAPVAWLRVLGDGRAEALRDYTAQELDVDSGEMVRRHHEHGGWWWAERANGALGWLPARDLELLEETP